MFLSYLAHESLPRPVRALHPVSLYWDADTTGWALAIVGVSQTIVSGGLVRRAVARLGETTTVVIGAGLRRARLLRLCFRADRRVVHGGAAAHRAVGHGEPVLPGPRDALRRRRRIRAGCKARSAACAASRAWSGRCFFTQILGLSFAYDVFPGAGYFIAAMLLATSLYIGLSAIAQKSA